ncbi:MAG: glycine cleavage system protein GcvH [Saprospiraceae bacterium]|jgi:glycine cleavage system H protein|uniref:Glycine cleavage system H protein n=1 Tax=Candidatus Defluviibacterium haderslevense TaxID=2981993 RepID=A0A9D7SBV3_9BACT|nr:glycine cleavage system protein GcvH [Candidatus Defluviibacterium haderslevense]MBK9718551.1 glycine cleavage system protein GcvH [Candidatus Defluviibacterium haderslevense]MBL0235623.1 glycine cleavage system protein GcvH [Candidatus Defluviibacterium haderslevense]
MEFPTNLRYTSEHEWLLIEGDTATIGITDFAQSELGDIVYVEVDTVGLDLNKEDVFGTVEAVKTTSDLFMPVAGTIIEFNPALDEKGTNDPTLINTDPFGKGWIVKIKISDPSQVDSLMNADEYKNLIGK